MALESEHRLRIARKKWATQPPPYTPIDPRNKFGCFWALIPGWATWDETNAANLTAKLHSVGTRNRYAFGCQRAFNSATGTLKTTLKKTPWGMCFGATQDPSGFRDGLSIQQQSALDYGPDFPRRNDFSFVLLQYFGVNLSTGSDIRGFSKALGGATADHDIHLAFDYSASGFRPRTRIRRSTSTYEEIDTDVFIQDNEFVALMGGLRPDVDVAGQNKVVVASLREADGWTYQESSAGTSSSIYNPRNTTTITVGSQQYAGSNYLDDIMEGDVYGLFMFDHFLTPSEFQEFNRNPWQIFQPPPIFTFEEQEERFIFAVPKARTKRPPIGTPIDQSSSLAKGLYGCYSFNPQGETDGHAVHNAAGKPDGLVSLNNSPTWGYTTQGWRCDTASSSNSVGVDTGFDRNATKGSIFIDLTPLSVINYVQIYGADIAGNDTECWIYSDGRVRARRKGTGNTVTSATGAAVQDVRMTVCHAWDESGNQFLYINGREVASAVCDVPDDSGAGTIFLQGGTTVNWSGHSIMHFAAVYDRQISGGEVQALHDNVWGIFKPERLPVPIAKEEHKLDCLSIKQSFNQTYRWTSSDSSYIMYGNYAAEQLPQGTPLTMAAWARNTTATLNDRNIIQLQDKDSSAQYFRMGIGDDSVPTTLPFQCFVSGASDPDVAHTTRESTLNQWHHVCSRFVSTTYRSTAIDGGNIGVNTNTAANPTATFDSIAVGREMDSTDGDSWEGNIMWPAIWDVALTDSEVRALANGASPLTIRPQNLKFFAPLDGRPNDMCCLVTKMMPAGIHETQKDPYSLVGSGFPGPKIIKPFNKLVLEDVKKPDIARIEVPW